MTLSCNAAGALERALSKAPVQAASGCPGRPAQRPVPARHHPPARALERQQCHPAEVSDQAILGLPVQCSRVVQSWQWLTWAAWSCLNQAAQSNHAQLCTTRLRGPLSTTAAIMQRWVIWPDSGCYAP